jgi:hypothetical protein
MKKKKTSITMTINHGRTVVNDRLRDSLDAVVAVHQNSFVALRMPR